MPKHTQLQGLTLTPDFSEGPDPVYPEKMLLCAVLDRAICDIEMYINCIPNERGPHAYSIAKDAVNFLNGEHRKSVRNRTADTRLEHSFFKFDYIMSYLYGDFAESIGNTIRRKYANLPEFADPKDYVRPRVLNSGRKVRYMYRSRSKLH